MIPGLGLSSVMAVHGLYHGVGYPRDRSQCGLNWWMYAIAPVEWTLIPQPLVLIQIRERYLVQGATVETDELSFVCGLNQVAVVELDKQGMRVQHGIDPVEHEEHQLALLLHMSAISIDILPILQQMHEVHPFPHTLDAYVELIVFTLGGWSQNLQFTRVRW